MQKWVRSGFYSDFVVGIFMDFKGKISRIYFSVQLFDFIVKMQIIKITRVDEYI